jgi:hypothetical protein
MKPMMKVVMKWVVAARPGGGRVKRSGTVALFRWDGPLTFLPLPAPARLPRGIADWPQSI